MTKFFISGIKNKLKETEGSALMAVVILFLVIVILVGSGSTLALSNYKKSTAAKENHSAYYLAESKINEFKDKMLTHLASLSNSDKEIYSKFTKEQMARAINDAVIPNLRPEPSIMNQSTDASSVELIASTTEEDSYTIKSSAIIENEERVLDQNVINIIKSFQTGVGDDGSGSGDKDSLDYGFIDKYGLIVKESFDLVHTKITGNMFFMNDKFKEETARMTGDLRLLDRNGKESKFYSVSSKSPQELYNSISSKWGQVSISPEIIENKEPKISLKKINYPTVPSKDAATHIREDQISVLIDRGQKLKFKEEKQLIWNGGSALLDLASNATTNYKLDTFEINQLWTNAYRSLFYIDVGDKDVHLHVEKFDVSGGLLVLGTGSLTIHLHSKNNLKLEPFMFTGVSNRILNNSDKVQNFTVRNNIVLVMNNDKKLTFNSTTHSTSLINASLIADEIEVETEWAVTAALNILALKNYDKPVKNKNIIRMPSNTEVKGGSSLFIYAPFNNMIMRGNSFKGFIFIDSIVEPVNNESKIYHDIGFLNDLPPSVMEVINQISGTENEHGNGSGEDQGLEYKKIKFESIREVTP